MKSFSHFSEDLATRRRTLKQRQAKQAADFKEKSVDAPKRAREEAKRKAAYKAQVRAELVKEMEDES